MSSYILTSPIDILGSGGNPGQINLYNTANTFRHELKAPSTMTTNVDFTLPGTGGSSNKALQRTGPTSMQWVNPNGLISSPYPFISRTNTNISGGASSGTFSAFVTISKFLAVTASYSYAVILNPTIAGTYTIRVVDIQNSSTVVTISNFYPVGTYTRVILGSWASMLPGALDYELQFTTNASLPMSMVEFGILV